jgi:hypothetical protein
MPRARRAVPIPIVMFLLAQGCSSPATPDVVIEPIQVDSVEVLIQESAPLQVSAHVTGVLGDGCATLHSVEQHRSGTTVTVTILRERPRDAVCTQIAKLYDEVIRLDGEFPPETYLLKVNAVEAGFTTR